MSKAARRRDQPRKAEEGAALYGSGTIRSFRDLIVWQRAIAFALEIYKISKGFPPDERFGLTSQLRRAAVSVSSNIAEGHGRQKREFSQFLSVARGSLSEAESQLLLSVKLGFLNSKDTAKAHALATEIRKMAAALASRLEGRR